MAKNTEEKSTDVKVETPLIKTISRKQKKYVRYAGIAGLVILILAPSIYFYSKYQHTQALLTNPTLAAQEETESAVSKVGRLMKLPQEDAPLTARVVDKTKLAGQNFFKDAENGDVVLIYSKSGKIILYRPSIDRIIDVATTNDAGAATQQQGVASSTTPAKVRVAVYNGSSVAGVASKVKDRIQSQFSQANVVSTANAVGTYEKAQVIDVSGKNGALVKQLAQYLSGDVSSLPAGEAKPDAEILVIAIE